MANQIAEAPPPAHDNNSPPFLTSDRAQPLASVLRSRPYWSGRTPRWVVKYLRHHNAYLSIPNYSFLINQIEEDYLRPRTMTRGNPAFLPRTNLYVEHSQPEGTVFPPSYALYSQNPRAISLEPIQAVVKIHTTVPALYSNNFDQLQEQIDVVADYIYEMEENLLFNHPAYGLLNNVSPPYSFSVEGPPSPDLLDDMLSRVWIEPDLFAMHPEALQEFHTRASTAGIGLDVVDRCGGRFTAWRGIPLLPTNKLQLLSKPAEKAAGLRHEQVERVIGQATTHVVLMRAGEEKQGVVGLYAANNQGSSRYPQLSVDFMGIGDDAVASYLIKMYLAAAVLTPDALAVARVRI